MSRSDSLLKRTAGVLAGVAVDVVRDYTVERLDAVANRWHLKLAGTPMGGTQAERPAPDEVVDEVLEDDDGDVRADQDATQDVSDAEAGDAATPEPSWYDGGPARVTPPIASGFEVAPCDFPTPHSSNVSTVVAAALIGIGVAVLLASRR